KSHESSLLHVSKNLRDTVSEQHLAKMGFLRDDSLESQSSTDTPIKFLLPLYKDFMFFQFLITTI
ncbi:MAG: hypothetical protein KIC78_09160, partial [Prevotella sp.]|uniref:hypothetical protein n=1 Tax=Prevotella sp. TaxID=59823 RepID=UPI00257C1682